jgi:DNA-binding winged helix-turn-helix (wHTH) protein
MSNGAGDNLIYEFGAFRLDPTERLLLREGQVVALTPKAFDLLVCLVEHHGHLVEKQTMMTALWPDTVVEEANLAYNISALRKALADGQGDAKFIETVPTRGYRFVAPVVAARPELNVRDFRRRRSRLMAGALVLNGAAGAAVLLLTSARRSPPATLPSVLRNVLPPQGETETTTRYDVFLSYRHDGVDANVAAQLVDALEADGYRVAIDERDFPANASFLQEMERCVRESRFTVAVISSRYLESGNCQEEAIICKVLDMGDRKRRLIPLVIEPVSMPAWLYGIVGIDCTKRDPLVDPFDKLKATLGAPLASAMDAR